MNLGSTIPILHLYNNHCCLEEQGCSFKLLAWGRRGTVTRYKHCNPLQQVLLRSSEQNLTWTCSGNGVATCVYKHQRRAHLSHGGLSSSQKTS
jgi:hypothetical protein